jgi:hypothetical protein
MPVAFGTEVQPRGRRVHFTHSYPFVSPLPPFEHPWICCLPLRWKHLRPMAQSMSLSQSPWQILHFFLGVQPLTPRLCRAVGL